MTQHQTESRLEELKPCPFCGSPASLVGETYDGPADCWETHGSCDSCGANGPTILREHGDDQTACCAEAREEWNKRANADATEEVRATLNWYAEQTEGCRKLGSIGDPFRQALYKDGGQRARAVLALYINSRAVEEDESNPP